MSNSQSRTTNVDPQHKAFFDRLLNVEKDKRAVAEAAKDLAVEMQSKHLTPESIAGIKLAVKRYYETLPKKAKREAAEHVADQLALAL